MSKYVINVVADNNYYDIRFIDRELNLCRNPGMALVLDNKVDTDKLVKRVTDLGKSHGHNYKVRPYKLASKTLMKQFEYGMTILTKTFNECGMSLIGPFEDISFSPQEKTIIYLFSNGHTCIEIEMQYSDFAVLYIWKLSGDDIEPIELKINRDNVIKLIKYIGDK